jgi:hypothetical protein
MLIVSIILSFLIIVAPLANFAYSQQPNQMSSNSSGKSTENALNIQDIPVEKVRVGDIDIAYKTFGEGDPHHTDKWLLFPYG